MGSIREELLKKYATPSDVSNVGSNPQQGSGADSASAAGSNSGLTPIPANSTVSIREGLLNKYAKNDNDSDSDKKNAVDENYIKAFMSDANSFLASARAVLEGLNYNNASDVYKRQYRSIDDLLSRSYVIQKYLSANKDLLDETFYRTMSDNLASIDTALARQRSVFSSARNDIRKYSSEEAYNYALQEKEWYKKYQGNSSDDLRTMMEGLEDGDEKTWLDNYAQQVYFSELPGLDLKKAQSNVVYWENLLDVYQKIPLFTDDESQKNIIASVESFGGVDALKKKISREKKRITEATWIQENEANAKKFGDVVNQPDFAKYSAYDPNNTELVYRYINGTPVERFKLEQQYGQIVKDFGDEAFDSLTDEEKGIYNYYANTGDWQAAGDYLKYIQDPLNKRKGAAAAEAFDDQPWLRYVYAGVVGLDQYRSSIEGFGDMIAGREGYKPPSATQYAAAGIREDLADEGKKLPEWMGGGTWGQAAFDAITTSANMAPSILMSSVVSLLNPTAGAAVGRGMMGAGAAGSGYRDMLNQGYSVDQARTYGTLVGAAEIFMEKFLGGIDKLGSKPAAAIARWAGNLDSALMNFAVRFAGNGMSEATEEGLQELLDTWLRRQITKEDFQYDTAEALYSGLLGFVTGGMFEAPNAAIDIGTRIGQGQQVRNADGADALVKLGRESSDDGVQAAAKWADNHRSAYNLGKLKQSVEADIHSQNAADISASLVAKGMDKKSADQTADAMARILEDGSEADIRLLATETDPIIGKTMREVQMKGTPLYQRMQTYRGATGTGRNLNQVAAQYGDKANAIKAAYEEGQDVEDFAHGVERVFTHGKEGGKQELLDQVAPDMSAQQRMSIYMIGRDAAAQEKAAAAKRYTGEEPVARVLNEDGSVGEAVRIEEVTSKEGGQWTYKTSDGQVLTDDQLSFSGDHAVLDTVKALDLDAKTASVMISGNNTISRPDAEVAQGIEDAYRYGSHGYSMDRLLKDSEAAGILTEEMRQAAYDAGKNKPAKAKPSKAKPKTRGTNPGVYFDNGNGQVQAYDLKSTKQLKDTQKAGVHTAVVLQRLGIGTDFYFFESYVKDGKWVYRDEKGVERPAPNGWYDPNDGSIHIDLNAGNYGKGLTLYTMAHELTHFIEQWSQDKYKVLADFLIRNYEKGRSVDELVQLKQEALSQVRDKPVSYEEAYSEVIADSMEAMLSDGNVLEKLAELKQQDEGLVRKMKAFFDNFVKKIRSIYAELKPESAEGQLVLEMKDQFEQLQQLFAEALADAGENFQAADGEINTAHEGRQFFDRKKSDAPQQVEQKAQLEDKYYARQIDKWDGKDHGGSFRVGKVSDPLLKIGIPDVDIWFDQSKAAKQLDMKEEVTKDVLKKIPYLLEHPIAISESYDNTVMVFGELYDKDGNPIVVALRVNSTNRRNHITLVNKIRSVGTRTHNLDKLLNDDAILYLNEAKKETNRWFNALGRSTPFGGTKFGLIRSISFDVEKSNIVSANSQNNSAIQKQDRPTAPITNRSLLANALESTTQDETELTRLREYRMSIDYLNEQEATLTELRRQIREISFGKGPRDTAKLKELQEEARKTANRINVADKKLLRLESAAPLRRVLEREKAKAYKQAQAKNKQMLENQRDNRNKVEMRRKIRKKIRELGKIFNRGTKDRNVKAGMRDFVASAIASAEVLFTDNYSNEDMVINGIGVELDAGERLLAEATKELLLQRNNLLNKAAVAVEEGQVFAGFLPDDIRQNYIQQVEQSVPLDKKITENMRKLKSVFERERNRLNKATVSEMLNNLAAEYRKLGQSDDGYIRIATDEAVYQHLLDLSESIGGILVRDMSLNQLEDLYDAYTAVLTTIQTANKLFNKGKSATVQEYTNAAYSEMRRNGIRQKDLPEKIQDAASWLNNFSWQNLRPVDAFRRTGSEKMMELFWDFVDGMARRGKMTAEIRDFLIKARKDTSYQKFELNKAETFTTVDGKKMKLTLAEKMSIYAYSKREAAFDHMTEGGFTYAKAQKYVENGITKYHNNAGGTWRLTLDDLQKICASLTENQRRYVDIMQKFLTEFGHRGNTISRELFGIDLFKEENYFPLMSNHDYLNSVQTDLGATQTAASLKNSGFTKSTKPHANNPIVLKSFDDVCMEHLDKMVNYIALTLPLENLRKVYDSVSVASAETDPQSTKALIGAVYGEEAKQYFDQFLKDANGNHGSNGAKNPLWKMFSRSKATAVSANISVVIQQISSVFRASAEISPVHLIWAGNYGKGTTRGGKSYQEMMEHTGLATIKAMGGFDVGSNRGLNDYIGLEEAPRSKEKVAKWFQDFFGMGAEYMDKVGWTMIWNAVKREVASRKQYEINSDAFFQACEQRFNEIIVKTQVFDSVLSRSGYMRSDNDSVKYLTSFMGEPTVTAGMVFNTHLDVVRAIKAKKGVGYSIGRLIRTDLALVATMLLNGMLKAIPYAMRDDDEDEAFWERWAKHLGENIRGDLNPLSLLPVWRDIVSVVQGRTVERPDMTLLADLFAVGKRAVEALNDEEKQKEMSAEDFYDLAKDLIGAIGNLNGLPVQNIWRDIESYLRLWKDINDGIEPVEMEESFRRGWSRDEETKNEGLYDAIISGDTARQDALKATYKDDDSYHVALRKALREYDPRIKQAAQAYFDGDLVGYDKLLTEIEGENQFDFRDIKAAIDSEVRALEKAAKGDEEAPEVESPVYRYTAEDYFRSLRDGNMEAADLAYAELYQRQIDEGYLRHQAKSNVQSALASQIKSAYMGQDISREDALKLLQDYAEKGEADVKKWDFELEYEYAWGARSRGYWLGEISERDLVASIMDIEGSTIEEAQAYIDFLDLAKKNEDIEITAAQAASYFENAEPAGISIEVYLDYKRRTTGITNDVDANGEAVEYSAVKKIMQVINSLHLTPAQKTALAKSQNWKDSTIEKYKLW